MISGSEAIEKAYYHSEAELFRALTGILAQ
jgi:hypothetical protein